MFNRTLSLIIVGIAILIVQPAHAENPFDNLPINHWTKLTPLENTPVSPRLGYEGDCRWDSHRQVMIRYGGHNQGGGGEQGSEVWLFNPRTAKWELRHPNIQPPGVCCAQQNVFDPVSGRYVRIPAFSHSHGWQWLREVYLNDWSIWTYDVPSNTWRNMRPVPSPRLTGLRGASWDSDHQVIVVFGGENCYDGTVVYDPYTNTWTKMNPKPQPEFRSGGSMAYDEARKLHIFFGSQFNNDKHTWAYDLVKNEWRDMKPAVMPPTHQNDAVIAYDPINQVIVALVKVSEGEGDNTRHEVQTWTYDAGKNEWKKMDPKSEPMAAGNRTRQLMWAGGLDAFLLENCTGRPREQQVWAYRPMDVKVQRDRPPVPPTGVKVTTDNGGATVSWEKGPEGAAKYAIHAGDAPGHQPWKVQLKRVAVVDGDKRSWKDEMLQSLREAREAGVVRFYAVQSLAGDGSGGALSMKARAQPAQVERVVVSVLAKDKVSVSWTPPEAKNMGSFVIERAVVEVMSDDQLKPMKERTKPLAAPSVAGIRRIGPFKRIGRVQAGGKFVFMDGSIDLTRSAAIEGDAIYERSFHKDQIDVDGKPYPFAVYAYRVRAVNVLGVEGGPSPSVLTIPSAVEGLMSKEDGTTCHLKWSANPEQAIVGYRVYRLDGRWNKDTVSRLTPEPIAETTFNDTTAGKSTRRYHVIAVDAIGQEGLPSSPVWFEREWKQYYEPFIEKGAWHQ